MEKEIIEDTFSAVLYTDGSCYHPSMHGTGYIGSSAHGYYYNNKNIGTPNKDNPNTSVTTTTKGYETVAGNDFKVTPDFYIDAIYTYNELLTNNVAEVNAIMFSIDKLIEMDVKFTKIFMKTDSAYAIHIYNDLLFGNPNEIELKKNSHLWFYIQEQVKKLKEKDIYLELIKVAGHSGKLGNEIADMLANYGRYISQRTSEENDKSLMKDYFYLSPAKKYWKPTIDRNPFLTVKSLYFTHDTRTDGKAKYIIMDYSTKKELGVATNAALFGMLFIKDEHKNKYEDIELILDQDSVIVDGYHTLSEIIMDTYYSAQFKRYTEMFGVDVLKPNKYKTGIDVLDQKLTARTFQGLARLTFNKTLELENSFNNYDKMVNNVELPDNVKFLDITNLIFETNEKGKRNCILGMRDEVINVITDVNGVDFKIVLSLGTELLTRNNFKKLEKTINSVQLEIVQKGKVIQVTTIIDNQDLVGVYTNFYTRNIILK